MGSPEFERAFRQRYRGVLILADGFNAVSAQQALNEERADLVVFGRPFIANPDLVEPLRNGWPLAEAGREAFYGAGAQGYIDFPAYEMTGSGRQR